MYRSTHKKRMLSFLLAMIFILCSFKSDTIGDLDEVVLMIRAEKKRIAAEYQKHFKEFERRYGNE